MMDKFTEFYMMQNQAKKFEQSGMDDKALELYMKIIGEYLPNNDFSFDRAATLLEKKAKYPEAIAVCEKAIKMIAAADIQGDGEKFKQKIERITAKSKSSNEKLTVSGDKEPESFHFGLPGFRGHSRLFMGIGTIYYALAAFTAYPDQLFTFLFFFCLAFVGSYGMEALMKLANNKTCTKALTVALVFFLIAGYSFAQIPQVKIYWAVDGTQQSEGNGEKTGEGEEPQTGVPGDTPASDTDRIPPDIPDKYLAAAAKAAEKNPASEVAEVIYENGIVTMNLLVKPGTSQDVMDTIADDMLRTLGGLMTSEGLKGPTDESYGELYTFYSASINVADSMEQTLAIGSLSKNAKEIVWSKP